MHPEKEYMEHLAQGRFMIQRSPTTGEYVFYPRMAAPGSGTDDLEWVAVSGLGTVYSTTVIRQKPPTPDYNLALIDLVEGVRMMSRVEGLVPTDVKIGMRVRAKVIREGEQSLVVFEPA